MVSQRIAVYIDLRNDRCECVRVLDLLKGDVFSLRQLEQVFLSVDNLEATLRIKETDVTGVQPAILIDGFFRVLLILVIALEDVFASNQNFTSWVWLVRVLKSFVSA